MFGFLVFSNGNKNFVLECPGCGRRVTVQSAEDVSNWEECKACESNRKAIEYQIRSLNSSAVSRMKNRRLQLGIDSDNKSEIIELVEKHYGSGKAMQVADILRGE